MIGDGAIAGTLAAYAAVGFSATGGVALLWVLWKGRRG